MRSEEEIKQMEWIRSFEHLLFVYRHYGVSEQDIIRLLVRYLDKKWFKKGVFSKMGGEINGRNK